jgi:ribose/xylose/arabinose/galactoside ABC-type transport system permease subunit
MSGLSKLVVVVWLLACAALPVAILLPAAERKASLVAVAAAFTAASLAAGLAYAKRFRPAWHLVQACMLVGVFLGGYWSNRWLFVGESVLMICLYFSLYAAEVRREFDIHVAPREVGVLLVLLGMCAILAILRPRFLEGGNLLDLARQFSMVGIMAVGMTMVIIIGGIDLSVGSVVAVSGCLATLAMHHHDAPLWVAVAISLAVGAAVGFFNGALISCFRMAPFVITLGTMSMARSLAIVVTGAKQVTLTGCTAQPAFNDLAWADWLGVPNPVWLMAVVVLAGHVFLRYSRTGRHIYYIGANEEAARLSGLNVLAIKWAVYTLCGLLAGLAGIVQASRVATGQSSAGTGDELRVIAAVIIGGASFAGGVGTVLGAVLGAAIMGVLLQGLVMLRVDPNWHGFVAGAVIIGAVAVDMLRRRR